MKKIRVDNIEKSKKNFLSVPIGEKHVYNSTHTHETFIIQYTPIKI